MKTFRTVGSGSAQTTEPIENNKIPVYDTKTDAEADLANLTVGQIIATKDEGSEVSIPVDVVQDGNMHAVTSNAVADYTYSKYDNTANYQKTFAKVGNLGTYTRIVDITAGTNLGYTENLSNLFTNILSVQISCASYGGRYIDTYWQNTNDASLTIIYTATNDTRMCFQVTGILKENYVEPF